MQTSTLTIRLPEEQRAALKERAKRLKKTESDIIRELLTREFEQVSFGERAGDFMGCVESLTPTHAVDSYRDAIKRNNWRPK